jgi:hypothetical protein
MLCAKEEQASLVASLTIPGPVDILVPLITGGETCELTPRRNWNFRLIIYIVKVVFSRTMLERAVALTEEHNLQPYIGKI